MVRVEARLGVYPPRHAEHTPFYRSLDAAALTRIFQAQVLDLLVEERRLSPQFAARLRTWRPSGFQLYRGAAVERDDLPAWERLGAYIGRAVFASPRGRYDPPTGNVSYRTAQGVSMVLDALEWVALLTQRIPDPGPHLRHHYGRYSNAARGKGKQLAAPFVAIPPTGPATQEPTDGLEAHGDTDDFRRQCRRNWERLIQKIYEVDPLICPDCGSEMHIIAFIDDGAVIRRILEHLHLWDLPLRSPPAPLLGRKMGDLLPDTDPEPESGFPSDSVFHDDVPPYAD